MLVGERANLIPHFFSERLVIKIVGRPRFPASETTLPRIEDVVVLAITAVDIPMESATAAAIRPTLNERVMVLSYIDVRVG